MAKTFGDHYLISEENGTLDITDLADFTIEEVQQKLEEPGAQILNFQDVANIPEGEYGRYTDNRRIRSIVHTARAKKNDGPD